MHILSACLKCFPILLHSIMFALWRHSSRLSRSFTSPELFTVVWCLPGKKFPTNYLSTMSTCTSISTSTSMSVNATDTRALFFLQRLCHFFALCQQFGFRHLGKSWAHKHFFGCSCGLDCTFKLAESSRFNLNNFVLLYLWPTFDWVIKGQTFLIFSFLFCFAFNLLRRQLPMGPGHLEDR